MFNGLIKVILSITSMAPVLLTYSLVLFLEEKSVRLIIYLIILIFLLIAACYTILYIAGKNLEKIRFQVQTLKTADSNTISFIIAYLFPFVSLNSNIIDGKVLIFVSLLIILTIFRTHGYHVNPLLTFIGYHFYEVTSNEGITYFLLSKNSLRKVSDVKNVKEISEYMLLDVTDRG